MLLVAGAGYLIKYFEKQKAESVDDCNDKHTFCRLVFVGIDIDGK